MYPGLGDGNSGDREYLPDDEEPETGVLPKASHEYPFLLVIRDPRAVILPADYEAGIQRGTVDCHGVCSFCMPDGIVH